MFQWIRMASVAAAIAATICGPQSGRRGANDHEKSGGETETMERFVFEFHVCWALTLPSPVERARVDSSYTSAGS